MNTHKVPTRQNVFEAFVGFLSKYICNILIKTSITPNQLTLFSGIFGLSGAYLLTLDNYNYRILSGIFIVLCTIFDGIDGDIARLKGMQSYFGQWLDIFFDKLVEIVLIASFTFSAYKINDNILIIIIGANLAILHLLVQYIMIYNELYFRNIMNKVINNKRSIFSLVINLIRFVEVHLTLKHTTLLVVLSFFVFINQFIIGLYILFLMSIYTFIFMCLYNFYLIKN